MFCPSNDSGHPVLISGIFSYHRGPGPPECMGNQYRWRDPVGVEEKEEPAVDGVLHLTLGREKNEALDAVGVEGRESRNKVERLGDARDDASLGVHYHLCLWGWREWVGMPGPEEERVWDVFI